MKTINILEKISYSGDCKLGFLLSCMFPKYKKSEKYAECSDNIKEIKYEKCGEFTIDFEKPIINVDVEISNPNNNENLNKCQAWVNFNGLQK